MDWTFLAEDWEVVIGGSAGPGNVAGSSREWSGSVCQSQSKIWLLVVTRCCVRVRKASSHSPCIFSAGLRSAAFTGCLSWVSPCQISVWLGVVILHHNFMKLLQHRLPGVWLTYVLYSNFVKAAPSLSSPALFWPCWQGVRDHRGARWSASWSSPS